MGASEVQMSTSDDHIRNASQLVSLDIGDHAYNTTLG